MPRRAKPGAAANANKCDIVAWPECHDALKMWHLEQGFRSRQYSICQEDAPHTATPQWFKPTAGFRLSVLGAAESADNSAHPQRVEDAIR